MRKLNLMTLTGIICIFALVAGTHCEVQGEELGAGIPSMCTEIGTRYQICPELLEAVIERESGGDPNAQNGSCIGLMQVSEKWHRDRMARLGVTDLHDPYGNILTGADYLHELFTVNFESCGDMELSLLLFSMKQSSAKAIYGSGTTTNYVRTVLARAAELERMHGK